MNRLLRRLAPVLFLVFTAAGCATQRMKGTPFFTGEFTKAQGPVEDRVNLWPLAYFREPALSVLWPLIEKSDTHWAVFPLVSVYGLDREQGREVNVLWPLSSFDTIRGEHRVVLAWWNDRGYGFFPLLWNFNHGERVVVFPLYWKSPEVRTLLPFFWKSKEHFWLMAGLYHRQDSADGTKGGHLFPFYLNYANATQRTSSKWVMWPLWHTWQKEGSTGHALFPLYWKKQGAGKSSFASLPWVAHRTDGKLTSWAVPLLLTWSWPEEGSLLSPLMGWSNAGDGFGYVLPLGFRKSNPDGGRTWVSWLGYLRRTPGGAMDAWALFPLAFRNVTERNLFTPLFGWTSAKNGTPGITYLFPLGLRLADAEGSRLLTPLWFQKNTGGLLKWYGLMPLFFRDVARDRLFTPLFGYTTGADGKLAHAYLLPLAARFPVEGGGSRWVSPLWFQTNSADGKIFSQTVLPLFHRRPMEEVFYSPLMGWDRAADGGPGFFYAFPVCARLPDLEKGGATWVAPFYLRNVDAAGEARWSTLLPLYYRDPDVLLTPLFGRRTDEHGKTIFAYATPLIQWWNHGEEGERGFRVFPLVAHRSRNATGPDGAPQRASATRFALLGKAWREGIASGSWFIPLYYHKNHGEIGEAASPNRYSVRGHEFWCLPWFYNRDLTTTSPGGGVNIKQGITPPGRVRHEVANGLFPLWNNQYVRTATALDGAVREEEHDSIGWFLYDHDRETVTGTNAATEDRDYVRHRVLWRLWHYERVNRDVSVDMFPGITYDRKEDGSRTVSFLWRFYRSKTRPDGTRELDVLFIPVRR